MGLDSYLLAKRALDVDEGKNNATIVTAVFPELSAVGVSVSRVEAELGYWRSNRALHRWFVENVQNGVDDCSSYWVQRSQLHDFAKWVEKESGMTAPEIEHTRKAITRALEMPIEWWIYYESSW